MSERIIPREISPQRDAQPERPQHGKGWLGLLVLAVLIAAGVWLFRRLQDAPPGPVPEQAVAAQPGPGPESAPPAREPPPVTESPPLEPPAITPGQLLLDRQRAEAALTDYLASKRRLEALAVPAWGGTDYARILAQVEAADTAFSAEQFAAATDGYQAAERASQALASRADDAVAGLMSQGDAALAKPDGAEAERLYGAVLAIRPDDEGARAGLRRSVTIDRVHALLETGRRHVANRLYELALTDFEEASRLDPLHPEARTAGIKVRALLQEQSFREAMTDALTALNEGRLPAARVRILQARALRPDAPEVRDALFQITEAERAVRIEAMGEKARAAEAAEKWEEAHAQYREVLAIDANIQFAREGAERCAIAIRMEKQMEDFTARPELLEAPDGRATARLLITEFNALNVKAPTLTARAETLSQLLTDAETPVQVTLQSDGFTRVEVYKVGRFPPFLTQSLELLPGTYTIVGYRPGFRDVRLSLEVRPGGDRMQTTVECRDRI
jgi:tetratricopeptide (TPR) repeat protein